MWITHNPTAEREQAGSRPALIISPRSVQLIRRISNEELLAVVARIEALIVTPDA